MAEKVTYYVLNERAVPDVLLKVVAAKKLIKEKDYSVQEATEMVGISRSSFYKYREDIKPFHEDTKGKTVNMVIQLTDEPGILSRVLDEIAHFGVNILTIHQSVPVDGSATLTLSVKVPETSENFSDLVSAIENVEGVHYVKNLARE
ncbi:MAG: ACT domain-containing protein [Pseudobutyrivibrio sp.]|nr:ACT domain-containing protein [Pseudobutyrivibrio sp.]